jgi:hypothetical protein
MPASPNLGPDKQSEILAGQHADNMIILIDEAAAIPDAVFDPLEDTLTSPLNFCLLLFNPTRNTGFALKTHFGPIKHNWIRLRWNAEESDIITPEHLKSEAEKYGGKNSNGYRVNVLGVPPLSDDGTVIPWDWVNESIGRLMPESPDDLYVFGVDVGGDTGGDCSTILLRRGPTVLTCWQYDSLRTNELAEECAKIFEDYANNGEFGEANRLYGGFYVDYIGIGKGVVDQLRNEIPKVFGVTVSEKSTRPDLFSQKRDELWWKARTLFESKCIAIDEKFPKIDDLVREMSIFKYERLTSGKIKIESKSRLKRRLGIQGKSPNIADAFCLSLAKSLGQLAAPWEMRSNKGANTFNKIRQERRIII